MNIFDKFKETVMSVVPVMAVVIILTLIDRTLVGRTGHGVDLLHFCVGGLLVIIGLTYFLMGVDTGIIPIGERSGAALTSKKNLGLLLSVSFAIGVIVTIAEPDVQVLAKNIGSISPAVNQWPLVIMIALGVGFFVMLGLARTVLSLKLRRVLLISYMLLFALAFSCPEFLQGAAFDAGGATTGPMTVPFIMALGMGVASVRAGKNSGDDASFGLTGIASIGPIAAVCIYGIIISSRLCDSSQGAIDPSLIDSTNSEAAEIAIGLEIFIRHVPQVIKDVFYALMPLLAMFVIFQVTLLKMPPVQLKKMFRGIMWCFAGLILFLTGAEAGFMPAGLALGTTLGSNAFILGGFWKFLIVASAFVLGGITVCAEPAVWVLTQQVEEASGGTIRRKTLLVSLAAGIAFSIGLSVLRILYGFSLWYILIPGYALALLLTFVCPPLFTGIAFDSGGVASGPMTSTFILSYTMGIAQSSPDKCSDPFGVIALVAMTPLIAIQILGIIYRIKTRRQK